MPLLFGCSNNLKLENTKLANENNQLRQQLDEANEKVKFGAELYDIRNELDILTYDILLKLTTGDISFLKNNSTNNISISGNAIISKDKDRNSSCQFDIPEKMPILRQRAFMLSNDKKQFHSIYEIVSNDKQDSILKTLNVYFVLDNGKWKLDFIGKDE